MSRSEHAESAPLALAALEYVVDAMQRSVLYCDVLRERGNQSLEHERTGMPPVLAFEHELVLDARDFEQPANYALVRILPPPDMPTDSTKRPFVVIDPRAGHGPGIGGFKLDSEIGVALKGGHPCYFVMFYPEPCPGQTIAAVARAEAQFLQHINDAHADADGKPFVIGNCQGGWALALLSACAPQLVGPILLAGSPVSYWAGVEGKNPMRYTGGLLGGSWLASLAGDLGNGIFDGVALVQNFEQLNPSNTYISKPYNLYASIDTERERFLEFERWWGGHFLMNKEEMAWIVQNLFIGNKLVSGELSAGEGGDPIDLRSIRSPIIVFASWGDNITPPQQALNWITDIYAEDAEIVANEQTIVYCLHERIGHLGIFVSATVAKKETSELVSTLDLIDLLPPGLYEAVIAEPERDAENPDLIDGRYLICFERRGLDDIRKLDDGKQDERAFEVVRRVSEINQGMYDTFLSPWVRLFSSRASAEFMRATHSARLERNFWSDLNPWLWGLGAMASSVRQTRRQADEQNLFRVQERMFVTQMEMALDQWRDLRDAMYERSFKAIYESPWLAAMVGLAGKEGRPHLSRANAAQREAYRTLKLAEVRAHIGEGSRLDAWLRMLMFQGWDEGVVDERPYRLLKRLLETLPAADRPTLAQLKAAAVRQAFVLMLDADAAIEALPALMPDPQERRRALDSVREIASAKGRLSPTQQARLEKLEAIVGSGVAPSNPKPRPRPSKAEE